MTMAEIVRGLVANKGLVKGKVKIVLDIADLDKVSDGDVLVANQTEPSFTIAMLKAAAFVTDIGGICSHAAIVARELGVPCIVAAKDATVLLKDGQEVIVDANKGIVFTADE